MLLKVLGRRATKSGFPNANTFYVNVEYKMLKKNRPKLATCSHDLRPTVMLVPKFEEFVDNKLNGEYIHQGNWF